MSMNLYLKINDIPFELWQTPTYITKMCMTSSNRVETRLFSTEAIRAIRCYMEWCKYENRELSESHIDELECELLKQADASFKVYQC